MRAEKIKVVCQGCGARYQVSSTKVKGRRFRATCKRCGGIIVARCTDGGGVLPEKKKARAAAKKAAAKMKPTKEPAARKPAADAPSWYVVISGKPHGPLSPRQLRQSFNLHKINERTYIWKTGDPKWQRLEDVEEFSDLLEEDTNFYRTSDPEVSDEEETFAGEAPLAESAPAEDDGHPAFLKAMTASSGLWDDEDEEDVTEETTVHFNKAAEGGLEQKPVVDPFDEPLGLRDDFAPMAGTDPFAPADENLGTSEAARVPLDVAEEAPEHLDQPAGWGEPAVAWGPADELWPSGPVISARQIFLPMPTGRPRLLKLFVEALSPRPPPPLPGSPEVEEVVEVDSSVEIIDPSSSSAVELIPAAPPPEPEFDPLGAIAQPPPQGPPLAPPVPLEAQPVAPVTVAVKHEGTFWTKGKIAAAAAICGGLGVASAVLLGVYLARSQPATEAKVAATRVKAAVSQAANKKQLLAAKSTRPKTKSAPKPAAKPTPTPPGAAPKEAASPAPAPAEARAAPAKTGAAPAKTGAAPAKTGAAPAKTGAAPAETRVTAKRAPPARTKLVSPAAKTPASKPQTRRVVVNRPKPRPAQARRRRKPRSSPSSVDALLLGSPGRRQKRRKPGATSDGVDGILAAGRKRKRRKRAASSGDGVDGILAAGRKRKRRRSSSGSADDILAAGRSRSSGGSLPRKLSKDQVRKTMRKAVPRVGSCYDKFRQSGIIRVLVRVSPSGRTDASITGAFRGTSTGNCVQSAVNRLRFPRFSGRAFSFQYPFRLR